MAVAEPSTVGGEHVSTRQASPSHRLNPLHPLTTPHPLLVALPPPSAAYDFQEDKQEEEGDADLAKIEQLKQLMGALEGWCRRVFS